MHAIGLVNQDGGGEMTGEAILPCCIIKIAETRSVALFDGHFSTYYEHPHLKRTRALGIHLFCLPPNTTHILQPLDVSILGSMGNHDDAF